MLSDVGSTLGPFPGSTSTTCHRGTDPSSGLSLCSLGLQMVQGPTRQDDQYDPPRSPGVDELGSRLRVLS